MSHRMGRRRFEEPLHVSDRHHVLHAHNRREAPRHVSKGGRRLMRAICGLSGTSEEGSVERNRCIEAGTWKESSALPAHASIGADRDNFRDNFARIRAAVTRTLSYT